MARVMGRRSVLVGGGLAAAGAAGAGTALATASRSAPSSTGKLTSGVVTRVAADGETVTVAEGVRNLQTTPLTSVQARSGLARGTFQVGDRVALERDDDDLYATPLLHGLGGVVQRVTATSVTIGGTACVIGADSVCQVTTPASTASLTPLAQSGVQPGKYVKAYCLDNCVSGKLTVGTLYVTAP